MLEIGVGHYGITLGHDFMVRKKMWFLRLHQLGATLKSTESSLKVFLSIMPFPLGGHWVGCVPLTCDLPACRLARDSVNHSVHVTVMCLRKVTRFPVCSSENASESVLTVTQLIGHQNHMTSQ